jgi:hypothetical protein
LLSSVSGKAINKSYFGLALSNLLFYLSYIKIHILGGKNQRCTIPENILRGKKFKRKSQFRFCMLEYLIDANKELLRLTLEQNPDFVMPRNKKIDEFFIAHATSDIAIILTGAKFYEFLLANHVTYDNVQYLNPPKVGSKNQFHIGNMHANRTLLLFDDHVVTAGTVFRAAEYYMKHGYKLAKIYICAACGVGKTSDIVICNVSHVLVH